MNVKILQYLRGTIYSDGHFIHTKHKNDEHMVMDMRIRGWGKIQYMFKDINEAALFQDEVGKFIAEAISEKVEKELKSAIKQKLI